jgi:hypothetical protein
VALFWNDAHRRLLVHQEGITTMIHQEKIAPPVTPMTEEQMKLIRESIADEDRWVKNFIDRLSGVFREVKH